MFAVACRPNMLLFQSHHFVLRNITGWIDHMLEGNMEGTAAGLLEECVLDDKDGKCEKFSNALEKLDKLLGVGVGEQY